jgi:ferredoxin-NADP reductase
MLKRYAIPAERRPAIFVCGPTAFVETVAEHLLRLGHPEAAIKTERFGPTGETT